MNRAESPKVREYFEREAASFDSIYSGEKNAVLRWLDRVFRKDMYERYRLTYEECSANDIRSVLDIGTGSGRFCLPLAREKNRVVGIDFSEPMIELAREHARRIGVDDKCEFQVGDFLEMEFGETFDAIMAIGLFDYIKMPSVFLDKMSRLARRKIVATYPTRWTWRAPVRWVRLRLQGCPVYFFSDEQVRRLYRDAGLEIERLERVGKIYFVVARPRGNNRA